MGLWYDESMKAEYYNPAATKTPRIAQQMARADDCDTMMDASIKAIILPRDILQQIRGLNIIPDFLNAGEIEDIIQACKVDCTLADDPDGVGLRDQMTLTSSEKKHGRGKHILPPWYYVERDEDALMACY